MYSGLNSSRMSLRGCDGDVREDVGRCEWMDRNVRDEEECGGRERPYRIDFGMVVLML